MKPYTDLDRLQRFVDTHDSFGHLLGIRIVDCTEKGIVAEIPLRPEFCNPHGIAHGGFLYAVADTACGLTAGLAMPDRTYEQRVVTAASSLNFLSPVTRSPVRAAAPILRAGRRIVVCAGLIYDGSGALAAKGTLTCRTMAPPAAGAKPAPQL